jgi:predicted aspartyl protease
MFHSYISQNTECYSYNPGDDSLNNHYKLYVNKTAHAVVVTHLETTNGHFNLNGRRNGMEIKSVGGSGREN